MHMFIGKASFLTSLTTFQFESLINSLLYYALNIIYKFGALSIGNRNLSNRYIGILKCYEVFMNIFECFEIQWRGKHKHL